MKNVTMKKDSCTITVPETLITNFERKGFAKVGEATDAGTAQAKPSGTAQKAGK
jgi:hypothetical protein